VRQFVVHRYFRVEPVELWNTIRQEMPGIVTRIEAGLGPEKE
jgi:uncharacterized protein with HEPN domain